MSARIILAVLQRNEAHRFLRSAYDAWSTFADRIVVVDDNSDDNSWEIARRCMKVDPLLTRENVASAWGAESPARAQLWDAAWDEAREGDWIWVIDCDMVPAADPRPLFENAAAINADAIAFPLYDLWSESEYREDSFWQAHEHPRVWAIRKKGEAPIEGWQWPSRGIHCGHYPQNANTKLLAVGGLPILHYGYAYPDLRAEKAAAYANVASQLSDFEIAHARSILDPEPRILPLPFEPQLRLERPTHTHAYAL